MVRIRVPLAVLLAVALFAVLHFLLVMVTNQLVDGPRSVSSWLPWLNIFAYALYLVSGFVAGGLSGRHFALAGLDTGFLSSIVAIVIFGVGSNNLTGIILTLFWGVMLGTVGGSLLRFTNLGQLNAH